MFNIVIFGAPGSGKGTQSENLIAHYGLFHISTGEVLRDHIARGTELGKIADKYISEGHLIPDDLMISILSSILDTTPEAKNGVIFDGFPRTIDQAKALNTMLAEKNAQVDAVIGLEVDEPELIDRIAEKIIEIDHGKAVTGKLHAVTAVDLFGAVDIAAAMNTDDGGKLSGGAVRVIHVQLRPLSILIVRNVAALGHAIGQGDPGIPELVTFTGVPAEQKGF